MKQIVSDICLEELKKSLKTAKLFYIINQENKSQNPQNQNVRDLEAHLSPLIGYYKVSCHLFAVLHKRMRIQINWQWQMGL